MKLFHFFSLLVVAVFVVVEPSYADHSCRVEITFKWKQPKSEADTTEHLITLEAKAADDAASKQSLLPQIDREKERALKECQSRHEDLTGCVSGKLVSLSSAIQSMGFSQRKMVEDAVNTDCAARQGKCGEVTVSEPQCVELITKASGTPGAGADEKGGKKDDKGKKK